MNTFSIINTLSVLLIQAAYATACSHEALCRHNSNAENARQLLQCSTASASLVVCNEKTFFGLGFGFLVTDAGFFKGIFWVPRIREKIALGT